MALIDLIKSNFMIPPSSHQSHPAKVSGRHHGQPSAHRSARSSQWKAQTSMSPSQPHLRLSAPAAGELWSSRADYSPIASLRNTPALKRGATSLVSADRQGLVPLAALSSALPETQSLRPYR